MKHYMKLFAALSLLLVLALSLSVVAEDAVLEEAANNTVDDIVVTSEIEEAVNLSPEIDLIDGELLMPEETLEISAPVTKEAPSAKSAVKVQPKAAIAIPTELTLGVKETYKINTSSLKGTLSFKSSKTNVATVNKKGVIKAKKAGKAKITIAPKKGKKKTITVTVKKAPTKVTLDQKSFSLEIGDVDNLFASLPNNTASNKFTWTRSNTRVVKLVTIDGDWCDFKAIKAGTATITVKTFNGKKATCKVTVKAAPKPTIKPTATPKPTVHPTATPKPVSISISEESVSIEEGNSVTLLATYTGYDSIYWKSDNSDIASCKWIDGWDGDTCKLTVYGWEAGSTVITVYDDSGKSVSFKVTVIAPDPTPTPEPDIIVNLPDTPIIATTYSTFVGKWRECEITGIKYTSTASNNNVNLYVDFSGKKTYAYEGESATNAVYFYCKLYDSSGSLVANKQVSTPEVAVGESWAGTLCSTSIYGLEKGETYTLQIVDSK